MRRGEHLDEVRTAKKRSAVPPEVAEHVQADLVERRRLKEYSQCFTFDAIGERYGLAQSTVYAMAQRLGLAWKK